MAHKTLKPPTPRHEHNPLFRNGSKTVYPIRARRVRSQTTRCHECEGLGVIFDEYTRRTETCPACGGMRKYRPLEAPARVEDEAR